MENKTTFGTWEGVCLLLNLINTQIFLNFPRSMIESGGTAGWIMVLYATVFALIGFYIIARLYARFDGMDLIDIGERVGGAPVRIVIGLVLIIYTTFIVSIVLREFGENIKTISLISSPISYVMAFFLSGMILGSYFGIEVIVRFSAFATPIIALGYYIIILAVAPRYNISNIFPLFGKGAYEIFVRGIPKVSMFSGILGLFVFAPFFRGSKNFKKIGYISILFSMVNLAASVIVYLMVFSYPVSLEGFLPIYQLARLIDYGRFFERVESMFVLIWVSSAIIYLSTIFNLILYVFMKTFKLNYYKPLILPVAAIVFSLSFIPPNLMSAVELEVVYFRSFAWAISFALPIVILVIAKVLKKDSEKEGKKNA